MRLWTSRPVQIPPRFGRWGGAAPVTALRRLNLGALWTSVRALPVGRRSRTPLGMLTDPIPALLAGQPLVTRAEALASGVSPRRWSRLHTSGALVAVFPGVSTPADAAGELTDELWIAAAVASLGGEALASHRSAALLWGVAPPVAEGVRRPIDVLIEQHRRVAPRPGVTVHRSLDGLDLQPSRRAGVPCTNPLRTLVDLGAVAPAWVADAFTAMSVARLVAPAAARAVLDRHAGRGRPGLGELRRVLAEWPLGDDCPDSAFEVDVARSLRAAGLGGFRFHEVIVGFEVDFAWTRPKVVLECDGFEFHSSRDAFELDRWRDATLAAVGWQVVRVTYRQVLDDRDGVIDRLRRTIAGR